MKKCLETIEKIMIEKDTAIIDLNEKLNFIEKSLILINKKFEK